MKNVAAVAFALRYSCRSISHSRNPVIGALRYFRKLGLAIGSWRDDARSHPHTHVAQGIYGRGFVAGRPENEKLSDASANRTVAQIRFTARLRSRSAGKSEKPGRLLQSDR